VQEVFFFEQWNLAEGSASSSGLTESLSSEKPFLLAESFEHEVASCGLSSVAMPCDGFVFSAQGVLVSRSLVKRFLQKVGAAGRRIRYSRGSF